MSTDLGRAKFFIFIAIMLPLQLDGCCYMMVTMYQPINQAAVGRHCCSRV